MVPAQRGVNGRRPPDGPHRSSFAALLTSRESADLLLLGRLVSFGDGQPLLSQGETGSQIVLIRRGRVTIRADAGDGQEALLSLLGPGDLLGEMRYLTGLPRSASVTAIGPVLAVLVEFSALDALLHRHPRILKEIARCVAERLGQADRRRVEFRLPVAARVARVLCELAKVTTAVDPMAGGPSRDTGGIVIPVTQRGLGEMVGAAEVTVQKALRQLAADGCVNRQYGRVAIVDPVTLKRYADGIGDPGRGLPEHQV